MRTLVDRYIDAYNRMDIEEMLLTVHPDVEFKNKRIQPTHQRRARRILNVRPF